MNWNASLTTRQVHSIFADEVGSLDGKVTDKFDDGSVMFTRAVLPGEVEVAKRDRLQRGVAMKAAWEDLWVHPYLLREICVNGTVVAKAVATRHVVNSGEISPIEMEQTVREAIRICAQDQDFEGYAAKMRWSRSLLANAQRDLAPFISRFPADQRREIQEQVYRRFVDGADETRYGLINAVTSLARDTRNPELRWSLETAGGALMLETKPVHPRRGEAESVNTPR